MFGEGKAWYIHPGMEVRDRDLGAHVSYVRCRENRKKGR